MKPEYADDLSISADIRLFRRVHLKQIVKDEDTGAARVSSGVFRDKELSVNIESILIAEGRTPDYCLRNTPHHKLVAFTAGSARRHNQIVFPDPEPEDSSHGIVYGSKNSLKICNGLRESSTWIIPAEPPTYAAILREKIQLGYHAE
jgi:hypothetical protein